MPNASKKEAVQQSTRRGGSGFKAVLGIGHRAVQVKMVLVADEVDPVVVVDRRLAAGRPSPDSTGRKQTEDVAANGANGLAVPFVNKPKGQPQPAGNGLRGLSNGQIS